MLLEEGDYVLNEKDLEQIGGPGIDTQYERDLINYRPDIRYQKPIGNSTGGLSVDAAGQERELQEVGNTIPAVSLWEEVVTIVGKINELESNLSKKLEKTESRVLSRNKAAVTEAAERLGYAIRDSIPFELYKKAFDYVGSADAELIKDAYEDYQSDVTGDLNAELYADVREMQQDWEDMIPFINKGLFGQIVSQDNYPVKVDAEDINLQAIHSADQQLNEEYAQMLRLAKVNEEIMYHLMTNEHGSERYYQLEEEVKNDRKKIEDMRRRLYTKNEVIDLIEKKASNASDSAEFINKSIDFSPYKGEEYEILHHILRQYVGKSDMSQSLRKLQAILKLSVDNKNTHINTAKSSLRGMAGRHVKKKINRTLVNGIHLRNEVFGDVYEVMEYFDSIPNGSIFENVASQITQGITQAESSYYNQSMDFFKIHSMDSELRNQKLKKLIDKDSARCIYKMIDGVLKFTKQSGKWPTNDNLTQWLNDFIEYYKSS